MTKEDKNKQWRENMASSISVIGRAVSYMQRIELDYFHTYMEKNQNELKI